jgi:hypothetical protein
VLRVQLPGSPRNAGAVTATTTVTVTPVSVSSLPSA